EDEHERQIHLCLSGCAFKFLPRKDAPKSSNHRRGLPYGIRNCHAGEAGSDQIEDHADAPDESAEQSERMRGHWSFEISGEAYGLTDQRLLHEINIPDQTRQQRAECEEDGDTIRT